MSFITTTEEMWLEQGARLMLIRQLNYLFGEIPTHYREQVDEADYESLLAFGDKLLVSREIDKIFAA